MPKVKVRAAAAVLAAARAGVPAGAKAAAGASGRARGAFASARPAATRWLTSREFPVLKSSVPNAGQ